MFTSVRLLWIVDINEDNRVVVSSSRSVQWSAQGVSLLAVPQTLCCCCAEEVLIGLEEAQFLEHIQPQPKKHPRNVTAFFSPFPSSYVLRSARSFVLLQIKTENMGTFVVVHGNDYLQTGEKVKGIEKNMLRPTYQAHVISCLFSVNGCWYGRDRMCLWVLNRFLTVTASVGTGCNWSHKFICWQEDNTKRIMRLVSIEL